MTQLFKDDHLELQWWRNYGYYVANKHNNVDAEACGYADGDNEYLKPEIK